MPREGRGGDRAWVEVGGVVGHAREGDWLALPGRQVLFPGVARQVRRRGRSGDRGRD